MIIICLGGGLGNQMFQYSFYLSMKSKYPNHKVVMDINNIMDIDHNGYELEKIFDIRPDTCSKWRVVLHSLRYPKNMPFFRLGNKLLIWKRSIVKKPHHLFELDGTWYNPMVDEIPKRGTWILQGYWINEGYHKGVLEDFPGVFEFPEIDEDYNKIIASQIMSTNSISIHVRHGDYLEDGFTILSRAYYENAVKMICEEVDNPHFFIFSDDSVEVLDKMLDFIPNKTYVSENKGDKSFRDMQLMSMCKHNIVANSTFSALGALLNQNPKKIVISPDKLADRYKCGYEFKGWNYIHVDD